jgi:trigger factor
MQVSVETTDALERRMEVSVEKERIEQAIDERLKRVSKTVKLKGFRPGKVPLKVVRQQFGAQVRQEVLSDLMQSSFAEAVTEQNLNPAAGPRIEPLEMGPGEDLKYRAVFEVFPEIQLGKVDGLAVKRPVADVKKSDIDAMVENLREQRPEYVTVERAGQPGDRVTLDFEGSVDGKPFDGGKGEDVAVVLGDGRMLKDFEDGIVGMKAGESRRIDVQFPDDYHSESLAGKKASFDLNVKEVAEKHLPDLDDEFCRAYGVTEGGIDQLRSEVGENMRRELQDNIRARLRQQLLDALLEANPVQVPKSLVDSQVREMQLDSARRIGARDASQVPSAEQFVKPAQRRVALGMLIGELIKVRDIKLDRGRVEERLAELVAEQQDPESTLKAYRGNAEAMRQIENMVLEDQVVDYLIDHAELTDEKTTFKSLMNFGA